MARHSPLLVVPSAGAHASWSLQRAWAPGATPLPSASFSYLKVIRAASCPSCLDCQCRWLPHSRCPAVALGLLGLLAIRPRWTGASRPLFYHRRQRGAAAGALQPLATCFSRSCTSWRWRTQKEASTRNSQKGERFEEILEERVTSTRKPRNQI